MGNFRNNIFLKILLSTIFCLFFFVGYAQISDNLKTELQKLSDSMYANHNSNFLIIDAVIDNKISLNIPCSISYDNGRIIINNKKLPKRMNKRYIRKIKKITNWDNYTLSHISQNSGGLSHEDIFTPGSTFGGANLINTGQKVVSQKVALERSIFNRDALRDSLSVLLVSDGLVDTTQAYTPLLYDNQGVLINNKLLSSQQADKYIRLINSFGIKIKSPGYSDLMEIKNKK